MQVHNSLMANLNSLKLVESYDLFWEIVNLFSISIIHIYTSEYFIILEKLNYVQLYMYYSALIFNTTKIT